MFYAVLNWKRLQFPESRQFWGIWKKMYHKNEIPLIVISHKRVIKHQAIKLQNFFEKLRKNVKR
jgi:hypothetical protein